MGDHLGAVSSEEGASVGRTRYRGPRIPAWERVLAGLFDPDCERLPATRRGNNAPLGSTSSLVASRNDQSLADSKIASRPAGLRERDDQEHQADHCRRECQRRPHAFIGHVLDTAVEETSKWLILLALPSGIEPLSPP
ncbi:hypothetical protein GCM10010987_26280 [Bradyrhizobium guangdongense]|uniref:Uncharacterized protein n=1 Tax=Bradyrhizobium guangdongense TaxID=1325090 RepID=A0AA88B817_9BRAD|nr:hypothetical protein GCM10010987_26280 [Bradyrhizobium guangdongense]